MTEGQLLDILLQAIMTIITTAAPPLLIGLLAGLTVSIFQTVTSIQDATLAFVPKILAIFLSILIFGSFMMNTITEFMRELLTNIHLYVR